MVTRNGLTRGKIPVDPKLQLPLFPQSSSGIEKVIEAGESSSHAVQTASEYNTHPSYGYIFDEMGGFRSARRYNGGNLRQDIEANYNFLEMALLGMHNMERRDGGYGMSHWLLSRLHPSESAAVYRKVAQVKTGSSTPDTLKFLDLLATDPEEFIVQSVIDALRNVHGFRRFYHAHYPEIHSVEIRERLRDWPEEAKKQFLSTVNLNFRRFNENFGKPNPEGDKDITGINSYLRGIEMFMKGIYEANTSRRQIPSG